MKIIFKGDYKSLSTFEWESNANLIIITGENGTGKTQFLELVRNGLGPNFPDNDVYTNNEIDPLSNKFTPKSYYLKITDFLFNYNNYLNWNSNGKYLAVFPVNYTYYQEFINWLYVNSKPYDLNVIQKLNINNNNIAEFNPIRSQSSSGFEELINGKRLRDEILFHISQKAGVEIEKLEMKDITCYLPINHIFNSNSFNSNDLIEHYVFFYFMQKIARENLGIETESMGEDPIKVLNNVLDSCGLKYEIQPFNSEDYKSAKGYEAYLKVIPDFVLTARKIGSDKLINFTSVSSGERIIVSLGFLEYYASYMNQSPSIMILDEIDAHLHPALIPTFFRVVNDILVKKFNTKVIMTTHNPSTIALAPKTSDCIVYKMSNSGKTTLIEDKSKNHHESINLLTEGLIVVNEKTKYVFVEDEDDVEFYDNLNRVNFISKKLIFVPASNRTKKDNGKAEVNQDGGKDAVNNLMKRFEALTGVFEGLIDKDSGNEKYISTLKIIDRYSLENYYFDPLVLFCFLNSFKVKNPDIVAFDVVNGKEHELKLNLEKSLKITNYIIKKLEPEVLNQIENELKKSSLKYSKKIESIEDCKKKQTVEFHDGTKIEYPDWLLNYRGKNLYTIFKKLFGYSPNNSELLPHFNTIGLYPLDIINKLRELL